MSERIGEVFEGVISGVTEWDLCGTSEYGGGARTCDQHL